MLVAQPQPLRGFDEECREFITEQYGQRGINLHPGATPEKIVKNEDGSLTLHLKQKSGGSVVLEGLDQVLMATGRKPNTGKLDLQKVSNPAPTAPRRKLVYSFRVFHACLFAAHLQTGFD